MRPPVSSATPPCSPLNRRVVQSWVRRRRRSVGLRDGVQLFGSYFPLCVVGTKGRKVVGVWCVRSFFVVVVVAIIKLLNKSTQIQRNHHQQSTSHATIIFDGRDPGHVRNLRGGYLGSFFDGIRPAEEQKALGIFSYTSHSHPPLPPAYNSRK